MFFVNLKSSEMSLLSLSGSDEYYTYVMGLRPLLILSNLYNYVYFCQRGDRPHTSESDSS